MAWNKNGGDAPTKPVKPKAWKGLLAGSIVVAGALAAFVAMNLKWAAHPSETEGKPRGVARIGEAVADLDRIEQAPEAPEESAQAKSRRERAEKIRNMSVEERIDFLFEEAEKRPLNLEPSTNRVFATGTEQVLSWIFTTRLGDAPPPLPRISIHDEAHLAEILMNANEIKDTDSDRVADAKEMVMLAKAELKKFIKAGGDIEDFLEYYRGELVQAHNEWQESQRQAMQVLREEPELAADFISEVNGRLREKGIKPVMIPPKLLEMHGIELYEE